MNETDTLEWRSIPNLSNYEVSEYGDVRRIEPARGATVGLILKPKRHVFGYPYYHLRQGGKAVGREAHRLVAAAFLGPRPFPKAEIAHNDGNVDNNHWTNLRYATHQENERDKSRHGTSSCGERNGCAKLTATIVREIRDRYHAKGMTYSILAKEYGVNFRTIGKIITRERWRHVG